MPYRDKEAQQEYQRGWIAKRRLEFFKDKKCYCCNRTTNLELDHINPEFKVDHKIWSWSKERRDMELAKCRVLCEDCHKVKTMEMREPKLIHGTSYMYNDLHCRCLLCRSWNSLRRKRQS